MYFDVNQDNYADQGESPIYDFISPSRAVTLSAAAEAIKVNYMDVDMMDMTPASYLTALTPNYGEFDDAFESLDDDWDDDDDDDLDDVLLDLTLTEMYQREREDPTHRMGCLLAAAYSIYYILREEACGAVSLINHPELNGMWDELQINALNMNLYNWLDTIPEFKRVCMIANHPLMRKRTRISPDEVATGNLLPSMVVAFIKGV